MAEQYDILPGGIAVQTGATRGEDRDPEYVEFLPNISGVFTESSNVPVRIPIVPVGGELSWFVGDGFIVPEDGIYLIALHRMVDMTLTAAGVTFQQVRILVYLPGDSSSSVVALNRRDIPSTLPVNSVFSNASLETSVFLPAGAKVYFEIIYQGGVAEFVNAPLVYKSIIIRLRSYSVSERKPTIYSTTEVDTGNIWRDGKHIYRQVFTGNIVQAANALNTRTLISTDTVDELVDYGGWWRAGTVAKAGANIYGTSAAGNTFEGRIATGSTTLGALYFLTRSTQARAGTTNNDYAVWAEYTKL